jgi:hypothetical protein
VAYLDGAGVKRSRKPGLTWSGKGWSIFGLERAGKFGWSWSQMGWTNGLEYLKRAGVRKDLISSWNCSQMGLNTWIELE